MKPALCLAALLLAVPCSAATPGPLSPPQLWEDWARTRVSPPDPWSLKHAELRLRLEELLARHPELVTLVEEGLSAEGRKIPLLRLGQGPTGVLLWSQMHGDEPTATSALLDLLNWLGVHRGEPAVRSLLANLTLWVIPMLNPDGTQRTQRRNAQEVDINRDALRLATPEGRFLKAVRDRVQPVLGFNLHNQSPLVRAGRRGPQAALSLLSVPGDQAHSITPGTRRTRQLAALVQRLAEPFAPGRIARYDMDYTARAFGDSMTRWGTATLLIESGGWSAPDEAERLVRLNFVVLAGALSALAEGSLDSIDPAAYERIPLNQRDALATLVVRNVRLAGGRGLPPFPADLAFTVPGPFAGDSGRSRGPALVEVGDLSASLGLEELDAGGMLAVPWPEQASDWAALKAALAARGLLTADEATLLAAVHSKGEAAVARPGYAGPVLFYRMTPEGRLRLDSAILRGRWAADGGAPLPRPGGLRDGAPVERDENHDKHRGTEAQRKAIHAAPLR